MYLIGAKNCLEAADFKLSDVSSKSRMENNGWSFDIAYNKPVRYKEICSTDNTWYGYTETPDDGKIATTFTGWGTATLDYGNCLVGAYDRGTVNVLLNDKLIDLAQKNTGSTQITFDFYPKDVLLLKGTLGGVIKLNSLKLTCQGKTCSMYTHDQGTNIHLSNLLNLI